tara:strand:+ start:7849 stop:8082 length:234 start_codon:yes stop_codon:yes gene_type:complete
MAFINCYLYFKNGIMTDKVKNIYKKGLKNDEFLFEIEAADGDKKPNLFSSNVEKNIFATIYYGWLVGKYGKDWELFA